MYIEITFINQSSDARSLDIVIFQKNIATSFDETTVAWKVIKNSGRNWSHKFLYPLGFYVATSDAYGNITEKQHATNGQSWEVIRSYSGDILQLANDYSGLNEVDIKNSLSTGSIDALIYKDGKLLAQKTGVSPGQKAVFEFQPLLYVGVCSQIEEGEIMNSAILSDVNHSFSLLGLTKANLVLTGGGSGSSATPYQFELIPIA